MLFPTKVVELNPRDNEHIKRLNDPADAGLFHLETWLPFAEAAKLERGNANVRPASERKKPFRDMVTTVEDSPSTFHRKNRGIIYLCDKFEVDNKNKVLRVTIPNIDPKDFEDMENGEPKFGIADGGHTFEVIKQTIARANELSEREGWTEPFVRVHFLAGQAFERTLAYAHAIGGTRAGVIQTTFKEETETDLFGEQAVLCGGARELIQAGWETLVNAGYQPEAAYFECLHELKLIVDLIYEGGIAKMHQFISETAKYGDITRGPRVVDAHVRESMKKILEEIQSGAFAKEWILENQAGRPQYSKLLEKDRNHPIEKVGEELRAQMSWLKPDTASAVRGAK